MRALVGGIPRAFASHRTAEGAAYGRYARAKLQRLGALPADARPVLKEVGRVIVELDQLAAEAEAVARRRRPGSTAPAELRRIKRERWRLRKTLIILEHHLETLVPPRHPVTSVADLLRARNAR